MLPPINTLNGGISFKNIHTQKGPSKVSVNISNPTTTAGVDLAAITMQIKPKACWNVPNKKPINKLCLDISYVSDIKNEKNIIIRPP